MFGWGVQNNGLVENSGKRRNLAAQVANPAKKEIDPMQEVLNNKIFQSILNYLPVEDLDRIQYASYRFYQATQAQIAPRINAGEVVIGSRAFTSNFSSKPNHTNNPPNNSRIAKFVDRLNSVSELIEHISVQLPSVYGDKHQVDKTLLENIYALFEKTVIISDDQIERAFVDSAKQLFTKLSNLKSVKVIASINNKRVTSVQFADSCLIPVRWQTRKLRTLTGSTLIDDRLTKLNLFCNLKIDIADIASLFNLEELNISGCKEVVNLSKLGELTNLKILRAAEINRGVSWIRDFSYLSSLVKLTYLDLSKGNITTLDFLSELKLITHLILDDCPIFSEGMNHVARMTSLVKLSVVNCKITHCSEKFAFRETLKSLNFSKNWLTNGLVKKISTLFLLTELTVKDCGLINKDLDTLLSYYPNLERLNIDIGSRLTTLYDGIEASGFETIAKIKTLQYLIIDSPQQYRRLTDNLQAVKHLIHELRQLKIFVISPVIVFKYFEVTTEPCTYFAELSAYKLDPGYGKKPFKPKFLQSLMLNSPT